MNAVSARTSLLMALAVAGAQLGCEDLFTEEKNSGISESSTSFMKLESEATEVGVGIPEPVEMKVFVIADAEGDTCRFEATAGTFQPAMSRTVEVRVDAEGQATAAWIPPDVVGKVVLSATVRSVRQQVEITVSPVPSVDIVGLPSEVAAGSESLFEVHVDPAWSNLPLEIRAVTANMKATGPVAEDLDQGTKIRPLTDATGSAGVVLTAPEVVSTVHVTASMFGTRSSMILAVVER